MLRDFFDKLKKKNEESADKNQLFPDEVEIPNQPEESIEEQGTDIHSPAEEVSATEASQVWKSTGQENLILEEESSSVKPNPSIGLLERLKMGLKKTRSNVSSKIDQVLAAYTKIDDELMEELEDSLIAADIGMKTTMEIMDELRTTIQLKRMTDPSQVKGELIHLMKDKLQDLNLDNRLLPSDQPAILLVIGVNGVGKTTTIGKLAYQLKASGKRVMLVAADTFRAAAIEQLSAWSKRAGADLISHTEGSDPAAVIYDGIASAKSKKIDVLICDTAGRLHNKKNLMNELNKIHRVIEREYPEAEKEVLLVLDATTGQNALLQAKEFKEVAKVTGIVLTKLDGTAKGGVVFPLLLEYGIPVKYIGIGEGIHDLEKFDPDQFIEAIFN